MLFRGHLRWQCQLACVEVTHLPGSLPALRCPRTSRAFQCPVLVETRGDSVRCMRLSSDKLLNLCARHNKGLSEPHIFGKSLQGGIVEEGWRTPRDQKSPPASAPIKEDEA